MLVVPVGLREIPDGALRLVVTASAQNGGSRVFIDVLIGPLPDIPYHIHRAERACPFGMGIDIAGREYRSPPVGRRRCRIRRIALPGAGEGTAAQRRRQPIAVSPRIAAGIVALRRVLPLPLVWQAFSGPPCILPRVFKRDPGHRLVAPALGIDPSLPIPEEV